MVRPKFYDLSKVEQVAEKPNEPAGSQACEICLTGSLPVIIDGRVRQGLNIVKGHWMYLCPVCHKRFGLGFGEDESTVYIRQAGRYIEQPGGYVLTIDEIQRLIQQIVEANPEEADQTILTGEVVVQLAQLNNTFKYFNSLIFKAMFESPDALFRNPQFQKLMRETVTKQMDEILEETHGTKIGD